MRITCGLFNAIMSKPWITPIMGTPLVDGTND